jgi:hypothetical protein
VVQADALLAVVTALREKAVAARRSTSSEAPMSIRRRTPISIQLGRQVVTNRPSGTVAGDEVTFLFVSYPSTTVRRPAKELKGFVRETVQPGQTVQVTIPLRISDLKYWDTTSSSWKIESGPVTLMVGGSSSNLPLSGALVVQ